MGRGEPRSSCYAGKLGAHSARHRASVLLLAAQRVVPMYRGTTLTLSLLDHDDEICQIDGGPVYLSSRHTIPHERAREANASSKQSEASCHGGVQ